jgi:CRP/FNR family transcriptional regulator, cyclic AMP receptor protein
MIMKEPRETQLVDESTLMDCLLEDEKKFFYEKAYQRFYHKHSIIHSPGDPTNLIYYIETGRVKIYNISESGKEVIFRFCHPGSLFGLAEVCGGERREVYAEAMEDSRVLGLERGYFTQLIRKNPEFSTAVFSILGQRLRQAHRAIQSLAIQDISERLAYLLLKLTALHSHCDAEGTIGYKLTHQEMANMIGATRSTVTEIINYFKEKGYIAYINGIITIPDPENLRELAEY